VKHVINLEHPCLDVTATLNGTVLASTSSPILLKEDGGLGYDPVFYFPMEDVKQEFLSMSSTRSNCYLKGEARYWSLSLGSLNLVDVAWEYIHPIPSLEIIKGHIAFYASQVKVEIQYV